MIAERRPKAAAPKRRTDRQNRVTYRYRVIIHIHDYVCPILIYILSCVCIVNDGRDTVPEREMASRIFRYRYIYRYIYDTSCPILRCILSCVCRI